MLKGKNVLLGVTASIAAYKAALIVRQLKKYEASVRVIQTEASLDFVTPLTLSTLSENIVLTKILNEDSKDWSNHVELGKWADLMIIAPVTARTMSKMAMGECDNLLLATYLSAECPIYFAPAMDLDMYKHPSTKENIKKLVQYGNKFIPSAFGELASGLVGEGRMAEPNEIIEFIINDLSLGLPLSGKKVLITAGPTYEPIDPVRFIGNKSTGKMGYHLALESANNGADVVLVIGPSNFKTNNGKIRQLNVQTAEEMYCITKEHSIDADLLIFAAAVSDYKPKVQHVQKIKKIDNNLQINLEKTKDILLEISKNRSLHQFVVGFALETENEIENAKEKLIKKKLDMIVMNSLQDKEAGFKHNSNKITIIEKDNKIHKFELKHKSEVAKDIILRIIPKIL